MAVNYTGYNYPISTGSIITTDSTPTSPKPGVAHYVGETTPASAQVGDIWTSSTGIRRWSGSAWDLYLGVGGQPISVFRAGSRSFSGSAVTIPFSSVFSFTPSVVATISGTGGGTSGNNYVVPLVYNVTTSGFSVQICDVEGGGAVSNPTWKIDWIATLPTNGAPANSATTANSSTGVTNGSGLIPVSFGYTYASPPAVVVSARDFAPAGIGLYEPRYSVKNITTTGFDLAVTYDELGTTPAPAGKAVNFNWIANTQGVGPSLNPTTAGTFTGTSASGIFNVNFGYTYSSAPAVDAFWTNGVVGSDSTFVVQNITASGFQIRVFENDGGTAGNVSGTWSWIATPYV